MLRPALIFSHLAVVIATIVALEMNHLIVHTQDKSGQTLGQFTAMLIDQDHSFRMSPKASGLIAGCEQGYLFVANAEDPLFRGVLVDYKNRGIHCLLERAETTVHVEPAPTTTPSP